MKSDCKDVSIEISYAIYKRNFKIKVKQTARVEFSADTKFFHVKCFIEDFQRVIKQYKYCVNNALYCKIYLSCGVYESVGDGKNINSRSFDGWQFDGIPEDAEGLHLNPDARYTDECHDIYIDFAEPLLGQLAEAYI